jgi:hypothetical protein
MKNRTRRAILCSLLAVLPLGVTIGAAHADPPGGAQVQDERTEPAPWRWACTHPRAWVNGLLYVEGGHTCLPEDVIEIKPPTDDPTQGGSGR